MQTDGRMDWRTDMTKLIAAFRNFANAPKSTCDTRPDKNKYILTLNLKNRNDAFPSTVQGQAPPFLLSIQLLVSN